MALNTSLKVQYIFYVFEWPSFYFNVHLSHILHSYNGRRTRCKKYVAQQKCHLAFLANISLAIFFSLVFVRFAIQVFLHFKANTNAYECIRDVCGYIIVVKSLACLHLSVNNKYFSPAFVRFTRNLTRNIRNANFLL